MANYCSYKDCPSIHRPFSSKTFFNLPNDDRREVWIKNSANERLKNLDPTIRRVFCEDHFDPKYLRRQFNRTILRREAIPYPYGEIPASQEIEFIEMAESEEESEQTHSEFIGPSNEENKVVILLNKTPNAQFYQAKPPNIIMRPIQSKNSDEKIVKLAKATKRKPEKKEEKNEEIDFIVLEEKSQDGIENSQNVIDISEEPVESNEIEQNACKKKRFEQPTPNESSQPEKVEEVIIQKPAARIKSDAILTRNSTDGIVSSSETVDANNEETYFALSLVGILKRLPPHKRAIAKCHILSYLTELEYGSNSLS